MKFYRPSSKPYKMGLFHEVIIIIVIIIIIINIIIIIIYCN